jgi:hypothetical protein
MRGILFVCLFCLFLFFFFFFLHKKLGIKCVLLKNDHTRVVMFWIFLGRTSAFYRGSDWAEHLCVDRIGQELGRGWLGHVLEEDLITSSWASDVLHQGNICNLFIYFDLTIGSHGGNW